MANQYVFSPDASNFDPIAPDSIQETQESLCVDDYSIISDVMIFRDIQTDDEAQSPSFPESKSYSPPSVEDLVRMAASKFIESHSHNAPLEISSATLSEEELKKVELAQVLLEAAGKVGDRQFDAARTLLRQCDRLSSPSGNPVQRLVFYYSRALRDRIDLETGRIASKHVAKEQSFDLYKTVMTPSLLSVELHRKIPFSQVAQFAGIQSIVEHVKKSKHIHVIDFGIRNGQQWTILMQALASRKRRRVEHFKITAVVTLGKQLIEQTGRRLINFARGMNLPCSFHVVMVPDLAELTRDHFEIEPGETVAVLAEYIANTLTKPVTRLDSVIRAVRSLYPTVMVVTEMEVNMNLSIFVNRFVESLFLGAAFFDCFEDCMDSEDPARTYGESTLFGEGSKVIVAIEEDERFIRSMKADVWRVYFRKVGMVEAVFSRSSLYQAELVAKKMSCWSGCTIGIDGKSLIVGWKGTPIISVTAWKFS